MPKSKAVRAARECRLATAVSARSRTHVARRLRGSRLSDLLIRRDLRMRLPSAHTAVELLE